MAAKDRSGKAFNISTRLSAEEYGRILGHSLSRKLSVAGFLREAISAYLDYCDKKNLLPLDYEENDERRTPRHLWG